MDNQDTKQIKNKRENYAKILSDEENKIIWRFLEKKFAIKIEKYIENFKFAQNRRGRLWIASKEALEFINKERFDPAKVMTCAIGKSDSKKLLQDDDMYIRLTIDGAMFFNVDIAKNILFVTEEEEELWYTGEVIDRSKSEIPNDVYVLAKAKTKQVIGSTIAKNGFLLNFVPKWRRPDRLVDIQNDFNEPENPI